MMSNALTTTPIYNLSDIKVIKRYFLHINSIQRCSGNSFTDIYIFLRNKVFDVKFDIKNQKWLKGICFDYIELDNSENTTFDDLREDYSKIKRFIELCRETHKRFITIKEKVRYVKKNRGHYFKYVPVVFEIAIEVEYYNVQESIISYVSQSDRVSKNTESQRAGQVKLLNSMFQRGNCKDFEEYLKKKSNQLLNLNYDGFIDDLNKPYEQKQREMNKVEG